ncbi:hypothetical protein EJ110_NYTH05788 [Nymphaea thermarum]|nr:hypothetical protein EJ110_NYTH05788 [Nymphaea thermarum]
MSLQGSLRGEESKPVTEYLAQMKGITDQLVVIGNTFSDRDKVQQILSGLGREYDMFCTALEVIPSFEELKAKLLQHELSRKRISKISDEGFHNVLG